MDAKIIIRPEILRFTTDYSKTVEELISCGGYGNCTEKIITANFPIPAEMTGKKIKVVAKLISPKQDMETKAIYHEINRLGLRMLSIMDLLSLGYKYPELQREFVIAALGSICQDINSRPITPILFQIGGCRCLYSTHADVIWKANSTCFLCAPQEKSWIKKIIRK